MKNVQQTILIDVTASGDYPSPAQPAVPAVPFENIYGFSAVVKSLAGQQGTLKAQVSNSSLQDMQNGNAVWFDLAGASFAINGAAVVGVNVDALYYRWLRWDWVRVLGAGKVQLEFSAKGT